MLEIKDLQKVIDQKTVISIPLSSISLKTYYWFKQVQEII